MKEISIKVFITISYEPHQSIDGGQGETLKQRASDKSVTLFTQTQLGHLVELFSRSVYSLRAVVTAEPVIDLALSSGTEAGNRTAEARVFNYI
jgi:hypothetical protein